MRGGGGFGVIASSMDEGSDRITVSMASAIAATGRPPCTCCFAGLPLRASALLPAA